MDVHGSTVKSWKLEKVDTEECGVAIYASSQAFLCFCYQGKGNGGESE